MDSSDDFIGFSKLGALLSIKSPFKVFNLSKLMKGRIILVGFQAQQRNISLDLASFRMNLAVVIFVNFLYNS
jgi:hypothetical protein